MVKGLNEKGLPAKSILINQIYYRMHRRTKTTIHPLFHDKPSRVINCDRFTIPYTPLSLSQNWISTIKYNFPTQKSKHLILTQNILFFLQFLSCNTSNNKQFWFKATLQNFLANNSLFKCPIFLQPSPILFFEK